MVLVIIRTAYAYSWYHVTKCPVCPISLCWTTINKQQFPIAPMLLFTINWVIVWNQIYQYEMLLQPLFLANAQISSRILNGRDAQSTCIVSMNNHAVRWAHYWQVTYRLHILHRQLHRAVSRIGWRLHQARREGVSLLLSDFPLNLNPDRDLKKGAIQTRRHWLSSKVCQSALTEDAAGHSAVHTVHMWAVRSGMTTHWPLRGLESCCLTLPPGNTDTY